MNHLSRRQFSRAAVGGLAAPLAAQIPGQRPPRSSAVEVLNPRNRVPLNLMIRRLHLPREPCSLWHPAFRGGISGSL